ncbi:MAG TPA: HAMP domain-containing protein, partial [Thioploca sp.]|nr:HAMP domain-containing protein [Thioploca sp.]
MMTLKVKLISAFFVVTIFVIVVGVIGIYTTNTINKNFDNVQQETVPSMIALGQLKAAFYRMFLEAVNIAFINAEVQALYDEVDESATPKQEHEDAQEEAEEFDDMEFDEAVVDMEIWFAEYEAVVWTEQGMVQKLRTLIQTNQNIAQELINLRHQNANRGEILEKKEELEYAKYLFSAAIERAIGVASAELEEDIQRSHQSATQAFVVNLVAIIISVLLAGFFGFFTTNAIATPITQFKEAAVKIGQGQLDTQVAIQSQDEVGVLANTFNKMAKDLKASYEQLAEYNRTLEDKVETRTHALSQANEELQTTVEQLQTTQQELIQSEKMAALGQLVAGVAHEINTPLGAINSAVGNINKFLSQTLVELPDFFRLLSKEQLSAFLDLLQRSLAKETMLSSKEERKLKRQLKRQLEEEEIEDADIKADTFVEMGIYNDVSPFLPLLQSSDSEMLLDTAYRLSSLQ